MKNISEKVKSLLKNYLKNNIKFNNLSLLYRIKLTNRSMLYRVFIIGIMILSLTLIPACQENNPDKPYNSSNDKSNKELNKSKTEIVKNIEGYTYNHMNDQIEKLQGEYQGLSVSNIGKSHLGKDLPLLELGKGEKKIMVLGGVHGREGLTSLLVMKIIEEYLNNYDNRKSTLSSYNLTELFEQVELSFLPMLNPDGLEIAVNGISDLDNRDFYIQANEGEKDFSRWKANARGVDLNKQFSADWEKVESTTDPHFESYKGPAPESEPESKALAQLTRKENFDLVICFHHSGRIIYWYYNQKGKQLERDQRLARLISQTNNYELINPEDSDSAAAGYKDWFIKEFSNPGFTIEIGYKQKVEKPLSANKLDKYLQENIEVILKLAENL